MLGSVILAGLGFSPAISAAGIHATFMTWTCVVSPPRRDCKGGRVSACGKPARPPVTARKEEWRRRDRIPAASTRERNYLLLTRIPGEKLRSPPQWPAVNKRPGLWRGRPPSGHGEASFWEVAGEERSVWP